MKKEATCVFCKSVGFWRRLKGVTFKAVACPICSFKFYKRDRWGVSLIENQKGGISVGAMLFFAFAYLLFCGSTFWFVRTETSKATEAVKLASLGLKHSEALDNSISDLKKMIEADARASDESYKKLVDIALKNNAEVETLKKKVDWLEMKDRNQPKAGLPSTVKLTQDKPLVFSVVYRPAVKKKVLTEAEAKAALVKKVKEKVKELSQ